MGKFSDIAALFYAYLETELDRRWRTKPKKKRKMHPSFRREWTLLVLRRSVHFLKNCQRDPPSYLFSDAVMLSAERSSLE